MNIKKLSEDMIDWVKQYCLDNGIKNLVVGVSGGVDSSVVAALCVKTGLPTHLVSIPMDLTRDKNAYDRAKELCKVLGIPMKVVEIGKIIGVYKSVGIGIGGKLSEGNLRSRVRMNVLYDFATACNGIVMGTGNKDEDEIGYMTKFGDSAVDLCPMSDLHKSVVWELGKFLGVPESIINAKPTAGLWDGQTDEDELGMTYAEVEWAIEQDELVENKAAFDEDGNWIMVQRWMLEEDHTPRQKEVLSKVRDMRRKNAHKLHYPPVFKVEMNKYE